MGVQERVLTSRLLEKIEEKREYAEKIGISVVMRKMDSLLDAQPHKRKASEKSIN